jgi:site-specific recombinase XerD
MLAKTTTVDHCASVCTDMSDKQRLSDILTHGKLSAASTAYAEASRSANTRRAYRADWNNFCAWCSPRAISALPASASAVCDYLSECAETARPGTLERRLAAIRLAHEAAGESSPTDEVAVRLVLSGIRRTKGMRVDRKAALELPELRLVLAQLGETLRDYRDRALLLVGFAAALRRSELTALNVEDLDFTPDGLVIVLRRSKTDQEQIGRQIGIPFGRNADTCVPTAAANWLERANLRSGPLFPRLNGAKAADGRLCDRTVARIVQRGCERAGLDPRRYGAHSLRSGFATSAARAGVDERLIAEQTGHRSMQTLRTYIRRGSLFQENAASRIGL